MLASFSKSSLERVEAIHFSSKSVTILFLKSSSDILALKEGRLSVMFSLNHTLHLPTLFISIILSFTSKLPNRSNSL